MRSLLDFLPFYSAVAELIMLQGFLWAVLPLVAASLMGLEVTEIPVMGGRGKTFQVFGHTFKVGWQPFSTSIKLALGDQVPPVKWAVVNLICLVSLMLIGWASLGIGGWSHLAGTVFGTAGGALMHPIASGAVQLEKFCLLAEHSQLRALGVLCTIFFMVDLLPLPGITAVGRALKGVVPTNVYTNLTAISVLATAWPIVAVAVAYVSLVVKILKQLG